MEKVNNENGIEMYWELSIDSNKVLILDSNKKYFNDLYFDEDENDEDLKCVINMLERTTLQEMCYFFGATLYEDKKELLNTLVDCNINDEDDYINTFKVNNKLFYTDSW